MRKFYRSRRNRVVRLLEESSLAPFLTILEQDAGLHFLLKVRWGGSDRELTEKLEAIGIRVQALSEFYHEGRRDLHCLVINYSGIREEALEEALKRIEGIL